MKTKRVWLSVVRLSTACVMVLATAWGLRTQAQQSVAPSPEHVPSNPSKPNQQFPALNAVEGKTFASPEVARQLTNSFDAGDSYMTRKGPRKLHRLAGAIAVRVVEPTNKAGMLNQLTAPGGPLAGYVVDFEAVMNVTVLRAPEAERQQQFQQPARLGQTIARVRQIAGIRSAEPVFIDPESGLWLIAAEEIIVRLKPGIDPRAYFGANWGNVQPLRGTTDQFILTIPTATAEQLLTEVDKHAADTRVQWAEPNFWMEGILHSTPNDTYYPNQWHLNNTGQGGATVGADIRAQTAWDTTTGNSNIIVAILDVGTQTNHPDLGPNLAYNPDNGLDSDNNGYTNDVCGWDFYSQTSDPNPKNSFDKHGTAVAGVAVARGNNASGVASAAYTSGLLPLRIGNSTDDLGHFSSSASIMAEAVYYAAGRTKDGLGRWRGADVLNMSFGTSSSSTLNDALNWAATNGRNGKGCPIFVSSGNSAGAWVQYTLTGFPGGTYTFKWEYQKDSSVSRGDDAVWVDDISFPGGTAEGFEGATFPPSGWTSGGNANWTQYSQSDRVRGTGTRSARSGVIGDSQSTYLQTTRSVGAGSLVFYAWVSSESGYDFFNFYVNSTKYFSSSGVPSITTAIGYPASHTNAIAVGASTDFDYRSDYSQYGSGLSFVAPSSGGASGIYTTDRTGTNGYNTASDTAGDYYSNFSGTSSASPLAAGVGALVLSVNPGLMAVEVRNIMRNTSDKIGGVTYTGGTNTFYGYGRINAATAVSNAMVNLAITKTDSPDPVTAGDPLTYNLVVSNFGPATAASVTVSDTPPATVNFVSATPSQGTCTNIGGVVICNLGTLTSNATATVSIVVTPTTAETITNTALVTANAVDSNTNNNTAVAITTVTTSLLTITQQPSSTNVCVGATAAFTVTATGAGPLTYQWQTNSVNLSNGGYYSGVTTSNLTVSAADSSVAGSYSCVVSNAGGSTPSSAATLTVNPLPIAFNVTGGGAYCAGGSGVAVGLSGSETGVNYQLKRDGSNTGSPVAGTGSAISFGSQTVAGSYIVVATGTSTACQQTMTGSVTVTLNPTSVGGTATPAVEAVCSGSGTTITLAGQTGTIVKWQSSPDNATWSDIASTANPYSTGNLTTTTYFRAVVQSGVCPPADSSVATVTVNTVPSVTSDPTNQTVCAGALASFSAAASGSPAPSVQWQASVDGGSSWSNLDGATTLTYNFSAAVGDNGHQYRAVFSNACGTANSAAATLTVQAGLLGVSPVEWDFGAVAIGTTVQTSFTVTNVSCGQLSGTATSAAPFAVVAGSPFTLPGFGATNVVVSFTPLQESNYTGTVVFTSDGGTSTNTVTGTGIQPLLVTPPVLNFGWGATGQTAQAHFVVTNRSSTALDVTATLDSGPFTFESGTVDAATKLLLHMDGTDGSTDFTDSSASPKTVTAVGNAQVDTAQSKFGGASGLLGGSGDYLTVPDSDDWNFGTQDFTIDLWVRFNSVSQINGIYRQGTGSPALQQMFWDTSGGGMLAFNAYHSGAYQADYSYSWLPVVDTWYHLALVRDGTSLLLFIDGTQRTWTAVSTAIGSHSMPDVSDPLSIGVDGAGTHLNGWLDEVRFTKGIARWTSNFTPPSGPYGGSGTNAQFTVTSLGSTNITVNFVPPTEGPFTNTAVFTSNGGNSTNTVTGWGAISPVASFTASPTNGAAPLAVTFTDTSTGTITNRFWNFGDSATTNIPATAIQHTYVNAGTNTVLLIVTGPLGASTNIALNLIIARPVDSVGDGIPDAWRQQFFGSSTTTNGQSCALCDPDGDGMSNLHEYLTGTDPTNSASAFRITDIAQEGDDIRVTWTTGSNKTNALEVTTGDASGSFTNNFAAIFTVTNTVGSVTNYLDVGAVTNSPSRYYRVRLVP